MEVERKNETRNKKRKESSSGTLAVGGRTGSEKIVDPSVKPGRVRKPRRGNRAGSGRPRKHNKALAENGEIGKESKPKMQPTVGRVTNAGGKHADGRNPKKKKTNLSENASHDDLQESLVLVERKKSKPKKTESQQKDALQQVKSTMDEDDKRTETTKQGSKSVSFLEKMRARLSGGRFRMLNESLYTCKGEDAFDLFQQDPGAFDLYHTGYQEQMSRWPVLPVTVVTKWLNSHSPNLVVADFGCGDARLAKNVKNKVFSLDLVSSDPSVIACNMAKTPLETSSVDVAVFCLSLMGTDYSTFLEEAHRVLRSKGRLVVAEVKSRLDAGNGGAGPQAFISAVMSLGFSFESQDKSNKMFHMFYFQKEGSKQNEAKRHIQWPELKPCIYKRR